MKVFVSLSIFASSPFPKSIDGVVDTISSSGNHGSTLNVIFNTDSEVVNTSVYLPAGNLSPSLFRVRTLSAYDTVST